MSPDLELSFTVSCKLSGLPFCWKFSASLVSLEMVFRVAQDVGLVHFNAITKIVAFVLWQVQTLFDFTLSDFSCLVYFTFKYIVFLKLLVCKSRLFVMMYLRLLPSSIGWHRCCHCYYLIYLFLMLIFVADLMLWFFFLRYDVTWLNRWWRWCASWISRNGNWFQFWKTKTEKSLISKRKE